MKKVFNILSIIIMLLAQLSAFIPLNVNAQNKIADPPANVGEGDIVNVTIEVEGNAVTNSNADIVLSIDTTSSMGAMFGSITKLEAAKRALKAFVNSSRENFDHVGLVRYSGGGGGSPPCIPPNYDNCSSLEFPIANMTPANKTAINAAIDSMTMTSGTTIGSGIDKANKELLDQIAPSSTTRPGVPKYIVLATDGIQNVSPSPYEANILQTSINNNIEIFGVGISEDVVDDVLPIDPWGCAGCPEISPGSGMTNGETIMKDVVCRTDPTCSPGGSSSHYYYSQNDPAQLADFYRQIQREIAGKSSVQVLDTINTEVFENIVAGTVTVTDCSTGDLWQPASDVVANESSTDTLYVVIKNIDFGKKACINFQARVHDYADIVFCSGAVPPVNMTFGACIVADTNGIFAVDAVDGSPRIMGSFDPSAPLCVNRDGSLSGAEINTCELGMPPDQKLIDEGEIRFDDPPTTLSHNVTVHVKTVTLPFTSCDIGTPSSPTNNAILLLTGPLGYSEPGNTGPAGSPFTFTGVPSSLINYTLNISTPLKPEGYSINSGPTIPAATGNIPLLVNGDKTVVFCVSAASEPWFQTDFGDVRYPITVNPITATAGKYGSTGGGTGLYPGIFFSSIDDGNYDPGIVSPQLWKIDDEYEYTGKTGLRNGTLSHSFYIAKARQDGITPKNITSTNINTGVLITEYTTDSGYIFSFDGNTTVNGGLNISNIPANKRVVILVKGNLEINSNITVDPGNLLIIAVTGDIIIDKDVGTTDLNDQSDFSLEGFYSAEGNIILDGNDCSGGTPDRRLNVRGALVANAKRPFADGGGSIIDNQRSLCAGNNAQNPYLFVSSAPDFLVQMTDFYKTTYTKWEEEKP